MMFCGCGGPNTVTGFGELFAKTHNVRVIVPTHPGFGGTARPDALTSIAGLAALYVALIGQLGLNGVTVAGNSIGGCIAAEMALLASPRVSSAILIDAVGIDVPGHPIADFFALTMDQVFKLSFHNPEPFRIDPATLPPTAQAIAAGNRAALATYAGTAMSDPTLAGRLAHLELPTLVLWGDSDQIADPRDGRAYAAAIPLDRRIGDLMRVGALNGAPSMRTHRNIRQMLALRISGGGERADGSGKIQVERRVDRRGHDISCCQGMSGARRAPGLER
jgi:pimeloyl-ACP methyl ester carboxylesterase